MEDAQNSVQHSRAVGGRAVSSSFKRGEHSLTLAWSWPADLITITHFHCLFWSNSHAGKCLCELTTSGQATKHEKVESVGSYRKGYRSGRQQVMQESSMMVEDMSRGEAQEQKTAGHMGSIIKVEDIWSDGEASV